MLFRREPQKSFLSFFLFLFFICAFSQSWHAGGMPGTSSIANRAGTLSGRMKSYYETVRSLNDATAARQPFQAIPSFAAAAAQDPDGVLLLTQLDILMKPMHEYNGVACS